MRCFRFSHLWSHWWRCRKGHDPSLWPRPAIDIPRLPWRLWEGGPSNMGTQVGRQLETMGDNGKQWLMIVGLSDPPGGRRIMSGNYWRQPETRIDKKGDKGRQDFGKADTPSNTGTRVGRQWERMETMGANGRPGETRPREGGHAIQERETRRWETMEDDKGRQDLGKADTPSPREGGHTTQQGETRTGTMGDKGRPDPREGGHTIQQRETRRGTMGDKRRESPSAAPASQRSCGVQGDQRQVDKDKLIETSWWRQVDGDRLIETSWYRQVDRDKLIETSW